jgi:hypothetical protein
MDFLFVELYGVVILVLIVTIALYLFIKHNSGFEQRLLVEKEKMLEIEKDRLKIAERKYMQGKIKKEIFDELRLEIEEKIMLTTLDVFRLKKIHILKVEDKLEAIYKKLTNPTKHRKVQLVNLLTETELVRKEIAFLEARLMKHEISESLFRKLIRKKEQEMISLELEIVTIVKKANEDI